MGVSPPDHGSGQRETASRRRPVVSVVRPQVTPPRVGRRLPTRPLWGLVAAVLVLGALLIGRLTDLQLLSHEELAVQAAEVSTREVVTPAVRGRILAQDGTPLAANAPATVVTVDPETLLESEDQGRALVTGVAGALGLPVEALWGRTRLCGTPDAPPAPACFSGSPFRPVPLAYGVDPVAALGVLERPEDFPGIGVSTVAVRDYPAPAGVNAAHVLGFLGRPTQEEVDGSGGSVHPEDRLGRAGLEQVYDAALRGDAGRTTVTVDPRGLVTGRLGSSDPVPGADLVTHLDVEVQAAAESAVREAVRSARADDAPADSAAAVVLRPDDGAVLAAASWPTYDPGIWTRGLSQDEYSRLLDPDRGQPLLNRVVASTFPPASTFKVVSLPAALQTGIDPDARYACPGAVSIAGQRFANHESESYGRIDLRRIVEVSCDTAFYRWAYDEWRSLGGLAQTSDAGDRYVALARGFGLGQPTGVDLTSEATGLVPSREWKRESWMSTREQSCARAEEGYPEVEEAKRRDYLEQLARENCVDGWQWRPGDAANFAIGQGDLQVTPLQLASVYAAVANGGAIWRPQVGAAVQRQDGTVLESFEPERTGTVVLDDQAWDVVRAGLAGVSTVGTASGAFRGWPHAAYPLAGKTGSAESFGRTSTGWYASYGPLEDPRYVVVVVVEQGGLGGEVAAPAARAIWEVLRREG